MIEKGQETIKRNRIYFLDNLRTFMIFLVIVYHAGLVYESSGIGAFFWIVDDPSTNNVVGILNLIMDIYIMATIFFVSGFFVPLSLEKKKGWAFLKSKFSRLMVPWVIAVLILMPLYKIIFLYSRDLPQQSWTTYFHFSNGIFSQSWLWFLPVLFLFNLLYLAFSKMSIDISKITMKKAVWAIFIIGFIYSICMDMFNGKGWTKTALIDFQNERLLIYFLYFLLGALSFKLKTYETKWKSKKLYNIINGISWIPITIYLIFLLNLFLKPGNYIVSQLVDRILIRFNFHFSLLCMLYVMISTFRYYLDKQGKIGKELNMNSYYVYILHVVVMGGIALTMLDTAIPSLLKYLILAVSTFVASNLLSHIIRKVIKSKA